jgi:hypothetical protein
VVEDLPNKHEILSSNPIWGFGRRKKTGTNVNLREENWASVKIYIVHLLGLLNFKVKNVLLLHLKISIKV